MTEQYFDDDILKDLLIGGRSFIKDGVRIPPEDMYKKPYCKKCGDDGWTEEKEPRSGIVIGGKNCPCHAELLAIHERILAEQNKALKIAFSSADYPPPTREGVDYALRIFDKILGKEETK